VSADLKKHGLTDKEDVIDPVTKRKLGRALVGPQHIIKLKHQVEKKLVARAGGPGYAYDRNLVPKGGGPHGAQALGTLGLYSMLAHGA
jgi:DNA-directed RNA polymerase beta subunit